MERLSKSIGKEIDPLLDLQLTSMNVILTVSAALRLNTVDDPTFKAINHLLHFGKIHGGPMGDIGSLLPSLAWLDSLMGTEKKLREFVNTYRDPLHGKIIQDALTNDEPSLIKDLYQMKEEGLLDDKDILVFVGDMIAAGTDTTAVAIYWAFAVLSQMPVVQAKMAQEIDAWKAKNEPGAIPSFQDRGEFPYMICVQKEIMRFRPFSSFGIPHMSTEDAVVDNYFIPKGTILMGSLAVYARKIYKEYR
ncbi:hypothetical protein G6F56_012300 [Rhizopus delemar]|nr:hypothetical protein G6F56_012300 [Rhizopus delemar]